jgi:hypothetical protein
MEHNPFWEANTHSASQEIPRLLAILSQMSPVHTFPHYFPNIHSNIILPSTSRSSDRSLPFGFCGQNFICVSYLPCVLHAWRITYHPSWFDHPNIIFYAYKLWSSSLCSLTLVNQNVVLIFISVITHVVKSRLFKPKLMGFISELRVSKYVTIPVGLWKKNSECPKG